MKECELIITLLRYEINGFVRKLEYQPNRTVLIITKIGIWGFFSAKYSILSCYEAIDKTVLIITLFSQESVIFSPKLKYGDLFSKKYSFFCSYETKNRNCTNYNTFQSFNQGFGISLEPNSVQK